ncbi:MAG: 16S rRNA (cytidine(1402)-2'-O)-methyltransferase [Candidatus Cybelea sp.]|jgi:16S rRNA (cytidine1402-2'-O)-methyltransferase
MPLIFVPTPLGNLRDVTLRALDVLREADVVVAEDTRVARRLLHALKIEGREIWSYREQNAARVTQGILDRARTGLVAVTSDAGTPGISDPGSALAAAARAAGVAVEVLPGPSAAVGVALLSGFPLHTFTFEGFPPRAGSARRERYGAALRHEATSIWFETPQRIRASLGDLAAIAPGARVFLVREYTKLHEQQLHGTPQEVAAALPDPVRGEIAFAIAPYFAARTQGDPTAAIDALLASGERVGEVAKRLAAQGFGDRHALYQTAVNRKAGRKAPLKQP